VIRARRSTGTPARVAQALVAVLLIGGHIAAAEPLSSVRYARIVADTATALEQAAKAGDHSRQLATAALKQIPRRAQVSALPGAQPVQVDNRRLLDGLQEEVIAGRRGIEAAARTLHSLQYGLQAANAPSPPDARKVLAEVLRRGEFKPSRLAVLQARLYRLVVRMIEWIIDHWPHVHGAGVNLRPFFIALLGVIAALTLYFIVRLVLRLVPRGETQGVLSPPPSAPIKPHAAWLTDAEAALNAGDYRAALRALHMAALMRLDEAGQIRYVDSRTDGRFVRALRDGGRDDLADALGRLSRLFAYCWYGMAPAGPAEYAAASEQWMRLEALAAA